MEEFPPRYKIETFKDLLNEIAWSWQYPMYDLEKHENGYSLNKLFITRTEVTYKTDVEDLAPGVFDDLEAFYEFLQTVDKKSPEESFSDIMKKQGW